jgi:uncharacterized protein
MSTSMTAVRWLAFFGVLLGALAGINYFVHRRVRTALSLGRRGQTVLTGLLAGSLGAIVLARLLHRWLASGVVEGLGMFGGTVQLGVLLSAGLLLLTLVPGAISGVVAAARRRMRTTSAAEPAPVEARPTDATVSRRALLGRAAATGAVVVGGGSSMYGAIFGRHDYVIEEVPIHLEKLPRTLDGFTIAQLSDIHFGPFVGEAELRSAVELVAKAAPDLIVLTGDLVDHDPDDIELIGTLARRLAEIAPVAAVPGNHDYYTGIQPTLRALRSAGVDVLVNRARVLGDAGGHVVVAGVDDLWARRMRGQGPDLELALAGTPPDAPRILLAHQPKYFEESAGRIDLQLSGHTHGGQINVGAKLVLPHGWVAGRYQRNGSTLYVNRGFGTAGPPARLGAAPEVTRFILCS